MDDDADGLVIGGVVWGEEAEALDENDGVVIG